MLDLTEDFEKIDQALGITRFGTIFCLSVIEHCRQPFQIAKNMTRLLKPGGRICLGVPFSWKVHAYPNDYWRFTPAGIKALFPELEFDSADICAATSKRNEFRKASDGLGKISFSFSEHRQAGYPWRGVSAKVLKMLARLDVLSWLTGYKYVMAPTNILLIGRLREGPA